MAAAQAQAEQGIALYEAPQHRALHRVGEDACKRRGVRRELAGRRRVDRPIALEDARLLAAAEQMRAHGREYLTGVVLAYEIYLRFAEAISTPAFDAVNFCCLGSAAAAGKLLGLSPRQLSHCISIAAVPT